MRWRPNQRMKLPFLTATSFCVWDAVRAVRKRSCVQNWPFANRITAQLAAMKLVSWNCPWGWYNCGRVRDPVKRLVLMEDRDRSVRVIRTLPLAVKETRTVTGATKPAAQGQCRLGQLALQAGVI